MKTLCSVAMLLVSCILFAGSGKPSNEPKSGFIIGKDIFGTRVFIENKGQYDQDLASLDQVYFVLDNAGEKIYFTSRGLVYAFTKHNHLSEKEKEALEQDKPIKVKEAERHFVTMNWVNSNPDIVIESSERQNHYFTFGYANLNSYGYKKITYRNVYNNIDIEYTLPDDKTHGIKYNVILHPGALISDLLIKYSGDVSKVKINKAGNVVVKTTLGEINEYAPKTFYKNGADIASSFFVNDNQIGFTLPSNYNKNSTVIIDPWVSAITSLSNNNFGFDVDYDNGGNVFVYGGNAPAKIAKYNSSGTLLWTFSGVLSAPVWSANPTGNYVGNFVVIKTNGKCYTGQGFNGTGTRIIRLDASGNYDNLITPAYNSWREVWDMAYHCSTGNVYGMGGSTSSNQSAGIVNQTTGSLTPVGFFTVTGANSGNDVVSHAIDDAGEFFWIYAGPAAINNKIARINSAFTSSVWIAPSTYNSMTEASNKNAYQSTPSVPSNGFNCLAVNNNFLFYYDGLNIAAYNKTNGALIASTTVPSYTLKQQGGIAVDDCNNLYLGGKTVLLSYHFNGSTFSSLPSIPLGVTTTTKQFVYDVMLDKFNQMLYITGSGFVGTYSAINSTSCAINNVICYNPLPADHIICAGTSLTISPVNHLNLSNPSYSIEPGNFTNNTGTFVITPTVNTNYTTYVTGTTTTNAVVTLTAAVNVTVNTQPNAAPTTTQSTCTNTLNGFDLGLSFTPSGPPVPGYTITWSQIPNGITSPTQTAVSGGVGSGSYTATIVSSTGCSTVTTFSINAYPDPANFNISPPGGNYMLTCYTPTLVLNFTPSGFNYTCTNGVSAIQNGPTASFTPTNSSGTWTCFAVNPTSGCTSSQTFVISQNTIFPTAAISPTFQNITCSLTAISEVTAVANTSANISHHWLSPFGGTLVAYTTTDKYTPGAPGTYTHCIVNLVNGCSSCKTFTIASNSGFPTFSVVSPQNFTLGCNSKSIAVINIIGAETTPNPGGVLSYTLLGPPTSTVTPPGSLGSNTTYTVNVPGTWTVITKDDMSYCESKVYVSVLSNTLAPGIDTVIIPRKILDCYISEATLEGFSHTPNVGYHWSFPGNPGTLVSNSITVAANTLAPTGTLIANYTLTVTDNNNTCKSSTVVPMLQNIFAPKAAINGNSELSCKTETVMLTNSSISSIPPYFNPNKAVIGYMWSGPSPQPTLQVSSTYVGFMPGTYTMIAKDLNNGCFSIATRTINDVRNYPSVNRPNGPQPFVLDCGESGVKIWPLISNSNSSFSYSWEIVPDAFFSGEKTATLTTNKEGLYLVHVLNQESGCSSIGILEVVKGNLKADFEADKYSGYAPLKVTFKNKSATSLDSDLITSIWSFGNGKNQTSHSTSVTPVVEYIHAGTYSVTMYAGKGICMDSVTKLISIEIPSELNIPNIFTPNGDGVNDLFFLKTSNLSEISMLIYDRWGHKVFDVKSEKGNVSWDGKNQYGKDVADGVYFYILNAKGKDGKAFSSKGNITVAR